LELSGPAGEATWPEADDRQRERRGQGGRLAGLPPMNAINDQFRKSLDASVGAGFEHTCPYPGLRKVVQAAGG